MQLRDYQIQAIAEIRDKYRSGAKKVLLYMMTGGGKSEVFCWIAREMASRGTYCFVVTRGRELVHNAHRRLLKRGIDAGILMAGIEFEAGKFVYVISIDTLNRRRDSLKEQPQLIVIDEAHFAGAASFKQLAESYPDAFYLAVTATPWQRESVRHIATDWVAPVTYDSLVAQGFLVPSKTFAPIELDLKGVREQAGDYREDDLMKVVDKTHVYGNIIKYYAETTRKAPALCFCVNVEHSKNMEAMFNANGIRARHLDADSSDESRVDALELLRRGSLDVITNCNILSTGVDIPELRAIISARPTASRILWVQQAGRGSRPHDGKSQFYLMDHANNTRKHGFIEEFHPPTLDGKPKSKKGAVLAAIKTCPDCFAVVFATVLSCERCGFSFERRDRELRIKESAELQEMARHRIDDIVASLPEEAVSYAMGIIAQAYIWGYARQSIYMKLKERYQDGYIAFKLSSRDFVEAVTAKIDENRTHHGLEKPRGFGRGAAGKSNKIRRQGVC